MFASSSHVLATRMIETWTVEQKQGKAKHSDEVKRGRVSLSWSLRVETQPIGLSVLVSPINRRKTGGPDLR
jgi:hypothetical protein